MSSSILFDFDVFIFCKCNDNKYQNIWVELIINFAGNISIWTQWYDQGIDTPLTWEFDRRIWSLGLIWFDCWVSWCQIESNISWIKSKRRWLLTKAINDEYGKQSQIAARARWWSVTTILKLLLDQKNNDWILFLFLIFDFLFSSFHFLFFDFIFFFSLFFPFWVFWSSFLFYFCLETEIQNKIKINEIKWLDYYYF